MRKNLIAVLLIVVMVFVMALSLPARASVYCKYARFNPGFALACYWEIMMDLWNPLDWGDGDADDYGNGSILIEENEFYAIKNSNLHRLKYCRIPRAC